MSPEPACLNQNVAGLLSYLTPVLESFAIEECLDWRGERVMLIQMRLRRDKDSH